MKDGFVADILRATETLRAGDPAGATAVIQAALAAGGLAGGSGQGFDLPGAPLSARAPAGEPGRPDADPAGPRTRRPLGEVLRILSSGREALGLNGARPGRSPAARGPEPALPEGAEFRDLTFSSAAGSRRYRLYVPASAAAGVRGMVLMLHGCTQTPEDFAAGTRMNLHAETHGLLVVYPAQTGGENSMSCWNWFRPGDQARDAGEPAILAGLTRAIRDEFAVPEDRIFVAGLSAGGAMAAILGEAYPELYAAIGVHSGLAAGSASDVLSAFAAMRGQAGAGAPSPVPRREGSPRAIVFHGDADTTVHPVNADRIIAGHGIPPSAMARVDHAPANGVRGYARRTARSADGGAALEFWLLNGAGHAWAGGDPAGSYTDPSGPDASAEMVRFFLEHDILEASYHPAGQA